MLGLDGETELNEKLAAYQEKHPVERHPLNFMSMLCSSEPGTSPKET